MLNRKTTAATTTQKKSKPSNNVIKLHIQLKLKF